MHYINIAATGYYGTDLAFFPLYPALIALLGQLTGNHLVAGLLISNAALFFGLLFFYKLVEHQHNRHVAQRAVFYISIFPTAIFLSAVYTESLFLALTVASFYYIREHKWLLAGCWGFLAALTRVEGVLLAAPLAIEWFQSPAARDALRFPKDNLLRPLLGFVLIPAGPGNVHALSLGAPWRPDVFLPRADQLEPSPRPAVDERRAHLRADQDRAVDGDRIAADHRARLHRPDDRRPRGRDPAVADPVLDLHGALDPGSDVTSSLMSMPRFALVLFPMFVIFALWGARPSLNNAIVAFSLPLLGLFTVLFADWYWVA